MKMINISLLAAAMTACLALTACGPQSAEKTQQDVAAANAKATENLRLAQDKQAKVVADAARDLQKTQDQARDAVAEKRADVVDAANTAGKDVAKASASYVRDAADARYDVVKTKAEGDYKVEQQRCAGLTGDAKDACNTQAKTAYELALSNAKADLDQAKRTAAATQNRGG